MTRYTVLVYVNVGEHSFHGYTPRAPLAEVGAFSVEAPDPHAAAEVMFAVGNKEVGPDADGTPYPLDVRSISVGDLIRVDETRERLFQPAQRVWFYACAGVGWTEIPEPTNPIVELAGSIATSRPASPDREEQR